MSKNFLTILIPLFIQMGLTSLENYLTAVLPNEAFESILYERFALFVTFVSIICTSLILLNLSIFLLRLLPEDDRKKKYGYTIINIITVIFVIFSLFSIFYISRGDWLAAMDKTLKYHFPSGSFFFVIHAFTTLFYLKKARGREEETLLRSIAITFFPLLIFFPLDMIFLVDFPFNLSYICFSILAVSIYLFISRNYVRNYEPDPRTLPTETDFFRISALSEREEEIARLLILGKTNLEIGEKLFISVNTVKTHIRRIYTKLNVSNRIQLIYLVKEHGNSTGS